MNTLAGDWWESGSWWQFVITIVVGIAVGVLAAWATLRASNLKRKLVWWVQSNTPLMSVPQGSADGVLAVTWRGIPIDNPRIVELVIANRGQRDITSAMFHNNEPIQFDFGATVYMILDVTTAPSGSTVPSLHPGPVRIRATHPPRAEGSTRLELEPSLLSRRQMVTVVVLLSGDEEPVTCVAAPLVDVQFKEGRADEEGAPSASLRMRLTAAVVAGVTSASTLGAAT
ncbi:hypothetical protein [Streptomyces hygroscopicus]|uniref:hypothetical protein n=1 Tax=Streptomyces hygroscopicus TaxID=1912 RepID=UPI0004CB2D34|nr:hypothetical protein [Streptomyces hygroscopicus]